MPDSKGSIPVRVDQIRILKSTLLKSSFVCCLNCLNPHLLLVLLPHLGYLPWRYYTLGPFAHLDLELIEARRLIPSVSGVLEMLGDRSR